MLCDRLSILFFCSFFLPPYGPGLFCAPLHGVARVVKYTLSSISAISCCRQAGAGEPGSADERFSLHPRCFCFRFILRSAPPAVCFLPPASAMQARGEVGEGGGAAGSYAYDLRRPFPKAILRANPAVLGGSSGPVSGESRERFQHSARRMRKPVVLLGGWPLNI